VSKPFGVIPDDNVCTCQSHIFILLTQSKLKQRVENHLSWIINKISKHIIQEKTMKYMSLLVDFLSVDVNRHLWTQVCTILFHIVACRAVSTQLLGKNVPAATGTHAKI
jgi:hypothetical protein